MFLIYPVGHDQAVYSRPWFTWAVAAACLGLFLWMDGVGVERYQAMEQAAEVVDLSLSEDPTQRISTELHESLPKSMQGKLADFVDDDEVTEEIEQAVADFVVAIRAMPAQRLGYIPADRRPDRAVSSLFAHGGWMHLIGNMILLLLFGSILECFWSPAAYILLYLGAGLAGVAVYHLADPASTIPLIGASGAIAGLISAILFGFARTRITMGWLLFIGLIRYGSFEVPAWVAAPLWGGLQIFSFWQGTEDGVAYSAHVGGFVFGLAFAFIADRVGWIARDAGGTAQVV